MTEKLSTKEKWEKVRERLSVLLAEFKNKSRAELEVLAEQEYQEILKVGNERGLRNFGQCDKW